MIGKGQLEIPIAAVYPLSEVQAAFEELERVPIYQTAQYQVKAPAVDKVKAAIAEFAEYVEYVAKNEPGSTMYTAWQQQDDPTRFVHRRALAIRLAKPLQDHSSYRALVVGVAEL